MDLTKEQFDILAHVVEDPKAWADHAEKTIGPACVSEKIRKYREAYQTAVKKPGYKTRKEREKEEAAALVELRSASRQAADAALDARIAAIVEQKLRELP